MPSVAITPLMGAVGRETSRSQASGNDQVRRAYRPGVTPAAIRGDGAGTRSPPCGAGRAAAASPVASGTTRQARAYSALNRPSLRDLDKLQRFVARPLDHRRARVAERVGLFEDGDALAAQLGDPGVETGQTERDGIVQLPARAHERPIALTHVPGQCPVADNDPGRRARE